MKLLNLSMICKFKLTADKFFRDKEISNINLKNFKVCI